MTAPDPTPSERRRRQRELEALMRELDRLDRDHGLGAMPGSRPARRPRAVRGRSPLVAVLLTTALLVGVVALHPGDGMRSVRRALGFGDDRLLPAPTVVDGGGRFAYALTQAGSTDPVGWDPCRRIRFVVNPAGAPPGGRELVERAVARTSAATGLAFEDQGDTDRRPFAGGISLLGRAEPVVVGWADADELPALAGPVAGLGGGATDGGTGRRYYVTGSVALDTEVFTADMVLEHPRVMEAIVLHELGHVVGLDHVSEPLELMYADNAGQVTYGPGDLEGLARLGSLPCR